LVIAAPLAWGLAAWTRAWQFGGIAVLLTVGLAFDLWVLRKVKRGLLVDPEFLDRKVPRT
jgi:hypothetical protein